MDGDVDAWVRAVTVATNRIRDAGVHTIDAPPISRARLPAAIAALAPAMSTSGRVTVDATASIADDRVAELCHRHLIVVAAGARDAVRWIRALVRTSNRTQFVVSVAGDARPWSAVVRERQPSFDQASEWRRHCDEAERDVEKSLRANTCERAEALLASLVAEAAVTHAPISDRIRTLFAELRVRQGRCPETGAYGFARSGGGREEMQLLQDLSSLLQTIHDSDDEYAALKRGCSWVREHVGADGVGIVSGEGTAIIAADGLSRRELDAGHVREAAHSAASTIDGDGGARVTAPMRYGGITIGFAVLRGRPESAGAMAAAGQALASACAPALRARLDALAYHDAGQVLAPEILGNSPSMNGLREAIARAAATPFPVLVEGESGTGKELVARALHRLSPRRDKRLSAINCAALTDELVEAELFGHARGAFTGALGLRVGLFEEAHQGTLFLDEVGELSPRAQAKLLRTLQEREIRRLGENGARAVDVRVVAATNHSLAEAVAHGRFREDLLFRLAVVRIRVPPLRDRIEDIPLLAQAFWRRMTADAAKRTLLGHDAIAALCRHRWPGNVRELQNVVAGMVVAAPSRGRVTARHVVQVLAENDTTSEAPGLSLDAARRAFERRLVASALARHGGRRTRAARELGLSRQGLTKAIKRLGLSPRCAT